MKTKAKTKILPLYVFLPFVFLQWNKCLTVRFTLSSI